MSETVPLGKVIFGIRQRMGLSQDKFCRLLNVTKGALTHWEHGRSTPTFMHLVAIHGLCRSPRERKRLEAFMAQRVSRISQIYPI